MKTRHLLPLWAPLLLLAACSSTSQVTDTTDLDGPAFGKKDETTFVAGADGAPVSLGNIAAISKTVRKYKNLGAGDQEILRRVAELKLDGLIAVEMKRLAPRFEQRKTVIRQKTQAKIAAVKKQATASRKPAAEVEKEVTAVKSEETREIAQVDLDWKSAARAEVAKNYGTDFAVPVSNSEGKAVVAFASMKDSGVSISSAAYELAGTPGQLASAADAGKKVTHDGASYALLDTKAVLE
ncbi:MAG: hypothetical protein V4726_08895 [Verrucomicrobiota bacterium]